MANPNYLTDRQYAFFRALQQHAGGLPDNLWPRPAVWERWMAQERFRAHLASVVSSCRSMRKVTGRLAVALATSALSKALADGDLTYVGPLLGVIRAARRRTQTQAKPRNPR